MTNSFILQNFINGRKMDIEQKEIFIKPTEVVFEENSFLSGLLRGETKNSFSVTYVKDANGNVF